MYVCSCRAITDREIRQAANTTVLTWRQLVQRTEVGRQCGICARGAKEIFDKAAVSRAPGVVEAILRKLRMGGPCAAVCIHATKGCNAMTKKVLVVGAGVSGLTTALALLHAGHHVDVWSKEADGVMPSTSLHAYAMWVPVKIDADPRVERWTDEGFSHFEKLAAHGGNGVVMRPIWSWKLAAERPWYADKHFAFRQACADELFGEYEDAHVLESAPVINPTVYLPWLKDKVVQAGGVFSKRTVARWSDIPSDYAAIINCSGLGARELAGDDTIVPERVQVVTIKPNGIDRVVIDDEGPNKRACIVPHEGYVKLGAVFDGAQECLAVDDALTAEILERCARLAPDFKFEAKDVLSVARALRPERSLTRVEKETLPDGRTLVHNYGHDGMGYILSHGIAAEIAGYLG